jgi:serine O-acetyltransferase
VAAPLAGGLASWGWGDVSIQMERTHGRAGPTAPPDWSEPDPSRPVPFWSSLRADIRAHLNPADRPRTRRGWLWPGLGVVLRSSGFRLGLLYRLAHAAHRRLGVPGRVLAGVLFWLGRHWYGCCLASTARLYGGLILPHPQGIVIGAGVVVGPRAWIFHNVTLGGAPGKVGMPRIGADARLFAGAVITGPVVVGDQVMIGANTVVSRDIPSRMAVRLPEPVVVPLPERFLPSEPEA